MKTKTKKLEKLLIVNDDIEDILAMQARLPDRIAVQSASQFSAREMKTCTGYDLIVVDNDANNLQESKGKETVQKLRTSNQDTPIIYTSFQPGWVPGEVYQIKGVQVVRTDEALEQIAKQFKFRLKPAVKKETTAPLLHILLSYNSVGDYKPGIFTGVNGEKVLVMSYEKHAGHIAPIVIAEQVSKIYQNFSWRTDRDIVKNIFIYDGINGGDIPGQTAQALGHDVRMRVNLMACGCDWGRKQKLANSSYVDLYQVMCGGDTEMGLIADIILGIKREGVDYSKLPISMDKIKKGIEKFEMY
jgi:hypothetical protein